MWKTKVIFITGPTASGKSDLAVFLAKKLNGEVINTDSRQIYKYLDYGSGKILDTQEIPHHLLSIANPKRNYSLGRWLKDSEKAVKKIFKKGKVPIFCGGTILYLRAIKEGWVLPHVKPDYKLRKELGKKTNKELYEELKKTDPERAENVDPNNKRRIIRALEIVYSLGKVPEIKRKPKYDLLIISPYFEKEKLFKKIKKRLIERVPYIIKEIKKLRTLGISFERIISFGLEYKWFGMYVRFFTLDSSPEATQPSHWVPSEPNSARRNESRAKNLLCSQGGLALRRAKNLLRLQGGLLSYFIEKCYLDILRFAKRQIRELRKIPEVIYVKNRKSALTLCKKFLKN